MRRTQVVSWKRSGSGSDIDPVCSFCEKKKSDGNRRFIAGPADVYICEDCVALCAEILEGSGSRRHGAWPRDAGQLSETYIPSPGGQTAAGPKLSGWGFGLGKTVPITDGAFSIDEVDQTLALHVAGDLGRLSGQGTLTLSFPAFTPDEQLQLCTTGDLTWEVEFRRTIPRNTVDAPAG